MQVDSREPVRNHLLAAIFRQAPRLVAGTLEGIKLEYGQVLYETQGQIRHVYFPLDCLVSLLTAVDKRRTLEVGMVGMPMALGIGVSAVRALVQGKGSAMRMTAAHSRVASRICRITRRFDARFTLWCM